MRRRSTRFFGYCCRWRIVGHAVEHHVTISHESSAGRHRAGAQGPDARPHADIVGRGARPRRTARTSAAVAAGDAAGRHASHGGNDDNEREDGEAEYGERRNGPRDAIIAREESMTAAALHLFDKHEASLRAAGTACRERSYFTLFSETPDRHRGGASAAASGAAAFRAQLGAPLRARPARHDRPARRRSFTLHARGAGH